MTVMRWLAPYVFGLFNRKKTLGAGFKRTLFFILCALSIVPVILVFFSARTLFITSLDDWLSTHISTGLQSGMQLHEKQTKALRADLKQQGVALLKNIRQSRGTHPANQENQNAQYIWRISHNTIVSSIEQECAMWRSYRPLSDQVLKQLKRAFSKHLLAHSNKHHIFDFYGSLYWVYRTHSMVAVIAHRYPPSIAQDLIDMSDALSQYHTVRSRHTSLSWQYLLIFMLLTMLIIMLCVWCAFLLAKNISTPLHQLLDATHKIKKGTYVQVPACASNDLANLVNGFNQMSTTLERAHRALKEQNEKMLTIFQHMNASVFVINKYGRIITYNNASKKLIESFLKLSRFKNKKVSFFGPQITSTFLTIVKDLKQNKKNELKKEISLTHKEKSRTFIVHASFIHTSIRDEQKGLLIVIEDVTDVVKVNRMKTWQEAARQMAHEIKNPLTPIQLATQRLKRRLSKQGLDDPAVFNCTSTILSHVTIIRNLVSHFALFATMPSTQVEPTDINVIIKEVTALYNMSYPDIHFRLTLQDFLPLVSIDVKKVKRILVNLLDNSIRAMNTNTNQERQVISIKTRFSTKRNQVELVVSDNGPGIGAEIKDSLFTPYVSREKKNMGLGLALVNSMLVQMGGTIRLLPAKAGAHFHITLPLRH